MCTDSTLLSLFPLGFKDPLQMRHSLFYRKTKGSECSMGVHFYRFHCLCLLFDAALIKFFNIYFALENATSKQVNWMNLNPGRWVGEEFNYFNQSVEKYNFRVSKSKMMNKSVLLSSVTGAPFGKPTTWDIDISLQRPRVSSKLTILERFVIFLFVSFRFKVIADALQLSLKKT